MTNSISKPFYKKTWFIIVASIFALYVIGSIIPQKEVPYEETSEYKRSVEMWAQDSIKAFNDSIKIAKIEQEKIEMSKFEYEFEWELGGFNSIILSTIKMKNMSNDFIFQKPVFKFIFLNELKEVIGSKRIELPILIDKLDSKSSELNLGFKPQFLEYIRLELISVEKL